MEPPLGLRRVAKDQLKVILDETSARATLPAGSAEQLHPVAQFRVIGSVSNMPDFARAFSCPAGAPMVRSAEKRCEVW